MSITEVLRQYDNLIKTFTFNQYGRSVAGSFLIGKAIGDSISLPSTPLNLAPAESRLLEEIPTVASCVIQEFNMLHSISVIRQLNKLNEFVPIDIDACLDVARKTYAYRYFTVYPPVYYQQLAKDPVLDFFLVSKLYSEAELELIRANSKIYISLYPNLRDFFEAAIHE